MTILIMRLSHGFQPVVFVTRCVSVLAMFRFSTRINFVHFCPVLGSLVEIWDPTHDDDRVTRITNHNDRVARIFIRSESPSRLSVFSYSISPFARSTVRNENGRESFGPRFFLCRRPRDRTSLN